MNPTSSEFAAPWSTSLRVMTILSCAVLALVASTLTGVFAHRFHWAAVIGPAVLLTIPLGSALFCIRSYSVDRGVLNIRRLLWTTRLPLTGLVKARADSEAMSRSLRLFGNGGLFLFGGLFWNRRLGRYRAWVTDPARCVVLEFANRKWVVSPERPEEFVAALDEAIGS